MPTVTLETSSYCVALGPHPVRHARRSGRRPRRAGYDSPFDAPARLFSARTDDRGTTTRSSPASSHHTASANSKDELVLRALDREGAIRKEPGRIVCQPSASKTLPTAESSHDPLMTLAPVRDVGKSQQSHGLQPLRNRKRPSAPCARTQRRRVTLRRHSSCGCSGYSRTSMGGHGGTCDVSERTSACWPPAAHVSQVTVADPFSVVAHPTGGS